MKRTGRFAGVGVLAMVAVLSLTVTPGYAASPASVTTKSFFPSGTSTVVGSVGFIDDHQVGYFWSSTRGDRVSQTVAGPNSVNKAILKIDVVSSSLTAGNHVDWGILINGHAVGTFSVAAGFTGPVTVKAHFAKILGPSYDVVIRVTNEVPGGGGAITLAYAGAYPHTITVKKT
jgi:hypothetical protein